MTFLFRSILVLSFFFSSSFGWAKEPSLQKATFAGGCFWCMEPPFEKLKGVVSVISGYSGGKKDHPTYEEVSDGDTEHAEVVQITFDPKVISYKKLLDVFWRNINPTDSGGQFVDRGSQYRSTIFYHNEFQKKEALKSKEELKKLKVFKKEIVTPIIAFSKFFPAEKYHQDFYKKDPKRYYEYRKYSGRDSFIQKHWKKSKDLNQKHTE